MLIKQWSATENVLNGKKDDMDEKAKRHLEHSSALLQMHYYLIKKMGSQYSFNNPIVWGKVCTVELMFTLNADQIFKLLRK